jgi:hypothetical protein
MAFWKHAARVSAAVATCGASEAFVAVSKVTNNQANVKGGFGHTCGPPTPVRGKRCRQMDKSLWTCHWCKQVWIARYWMTASREHRLTWKKAR